MHWMWYRTLQCVLSYTIHTAEICLVLCLSVFYAFFFLYIFSSTATTIRFRPQLSHWFQFVKSLSHDWVILLLLLRVMLLYALRYRSHFISISRVKIEPLIFKTFFPLPPRQWEDYQADPVTAGKFYKWTFIFVIFKFKIHGYWILFNKLGYSKALEQNKGSIKHWNLHKTIRVPMKVKSRHNKAIGILKINLVSSPPPYHPTGLTSRKIGWQNCDICLVKRSISL